MINKLDEAEEMKKEIENKFEGDKLKIFSSAFNLLKIKKEDIQEKIKNKIKKYENINNKMDLNDIINNENNINNKNEDDNYYSNFITSLIKIL